MSEITTTPATARTDTRTDTSRSDVASATSSTTPAVPARITRSAVRRAGVGLAAGAAAFATTFFVYGTADSGLASRISDLGGLALQLGLFGLLAVMLRTGATGHSRFARGMIRFEFGLLSLASIWSVLHAVVPDDMRGAGWLAVLDVFWPLSMLGMFVIGIKVAVAGRWTGLLRVWPLVAESWAVVVLPIMGIFGPTVGGPAAGLHLLLGYGILGVLLARMPERTGAS